MTISDESTLRLQSGSDLFVPHIGWLRYPSSDIVLLRLREGSFEFREQAFLWSFLRESDTFLNIGAPQVLTECRNTQPSFAAICPLRPRTCPGRQLLAGIV